MLEKQPSKDIYENVTLALLDYSRLVKRAVYKWYTEMQGLENYFASIYCIKMFPGSTKEKENHDRYQIMLN